MCKGSWRGGGEKLGRLHVANHEDISWSTAEWLLVKCLNGFKSQGS